MRTFKELKRAARLEIGGSPVKIALLGDTATQLLATAIEGEGKLAGMNIELYESDFNQVEQQILDPGSEYHAFRPDFTVIFLSTHKFLEQFSFTENDQRNEMWRVRLTLMETLAAHGEGHIIFFNYPEIDDAVFGSYANKTRDSFIYQIRKLNLALMEMASAEGNVSVCDIDALQAKLGRNNMFDPNIYVTTELVLSLDSLPLVALKVIAIILSIRGKFKKCLICDLDNTLWGGVVGDDGWENIQIGHGLGIGKAFSEFQQWIKKLKDRGIILAVCSKNNEEVALEAFRHNPEMVLKEDDIAVFVANWENKADNIRRIQKILNIGFDSMVFLDDNPFERNLVRENLPDITVPELPPDPADYLEFLYGENLFETASYSGLDSDRTRQYQTEAKRNSAKMQFTNEDDFLSSLGMKSKVEGFTLFNIPRVAQLSQRSNQFNLRTVRYSEEDIKRIEEDKARYKTFAFSLEDKFGDNGLICVVILEKTDTSTLFINTWFMSCRVLKRGMENFVMARIVEYARENGYRTIMGEYIPTPKNSLVKDHYQGLGFRPVGDNERNLYQLSVEEYEPLLTHIERLEE